MAWPCARAQCGSGEPRIVMWVALWDARVSGRAMSAREVALDAKGARRSRRRCRNVISRYSIQPYAQFSWERGARLYCFGARGAAN